MKEKIQEKIRHYRRNGWHLSRWDYLAYAFTRGIPYRNVEPTTREDVATTPHMDYVLHLTAEILCDREGKGIIVGAKERDEFRRLMDETKESIRAWMSVPEDAGRYQLRQYHKHAARERKVQAAEAWKSKRVGDRP